MMYFPFYVDLTEKDILFAGGGRIAARRVHTLLPFAENITVIAPEFDVFFRDLVQDGAVKIRLLRRPFEWQDLNGRDYVFAATGDVTLNEAIARACRQRRIPVNVCSDRTLCDFQFPSVVTDGEVVIGINASGENHLLVKETRKKLERFLGNGNEKS